MSKQRSRPRTLIGQPHSEDRIMVRPAPYSTAQAEERNMAGLSRRLHQDAAQLGERANRLAGQMGYSLNLLHFLVDGCRALEFHGLGGGVALALQPGEHGGATGGEKRKYIRRLLLVALIRAAL